MNQCSLYRLWWWCNKWYYRWGGWHLYRCNKSLFNRWRVNVIRWCISKNRCMPSPSRMCPSPSSPYTSWSSNGWYRLLMKWWTTPHMRASSPSPYISWSSNGWYRLLMRWWTNPRMRPSPSSPYTSWLSNGWCQLLMRWWTNVNRWLHSGNNWCMPNLPRTRPLSCRRTSPDGGWSCVVASTLNGASKQSISCMASNTVVHSLQMCKSSGGAMSYIWCMLVVYKSNRR